MVDVGVMGAWKYNLFFHVDIVYVNLIILHVKNLILFFVVLNENEPSPLYKNKILHKIKVIIRNTSLNQLKKNGDPT